MKGKYLKIKYIKRFTPSMGLNTGAQKQCGIYMSSSKQTTNTRMPSGKKAAPNCPFDAFVGVLAPLAPSCRQSGNFGSAWDVVVRNKPPLRQKVSPPKKKKE
jgi:hypothetical protein